MSDANRQRNEIPLDALLALPTDNVVRLELDHCRGRRFRVMFLLELFLGLCVFVCTLPLIVVLVLLGAGGEFDLPNLQSLQRRAWVHWHEIVFHLVGAQKETIAVARQVVPGPAEGDAALGAVLLWARGAGLVVVERIDSGAPVAAWYGGQPLFLPPEKIDVDRARRVFERSGGAMEQSGDAYELTLEESRVGRIGAWLLLLFVSPFWLWTQGGRARLGECWADARGVDARYVYRVDAGGVGVERRRGDATWSSQSFDKADVLGVSWAPILGYPPDVARLSARLRVHTKVDSFEVVVPGRDDMGPAVRDLMVAAAQRLWGDLGGPGAVGHCPFCGMVYPFVPGESCPSCGAPPGRLHGLPNPRSASV